MELMIAEIIVKAAVLSGLLYLIARDEADFEFSKVAMVVCLISTATFCVDMVFLIYLVSFPSLGWMIFAFALRYGISAAFVVLVIVKFCWVRLHKAILVTILFYVFNGILALGVGFVQRKLGESVENAGGTAMSRHDADLQEAAEQASAMLDYGDEVARQQAAVAEQELQAAAAAAAAKEPEVHRMELPVKKGKGEVKGLRGTRDTLVVSAVVTGEDGTRYAVINGQMVEEGGIIEFERDKQKEFWKVAEVRPEGVIWEPVNPP